MPRRQHTITLPPELSRRLEGFAEARGATMSGVIEEAVTKHLGDEHEWDVLYRRLDRHTRALTRLQRDVDVVLEAFGAFVQVWYGHTRPLAESERESARREAWANYQKFMGVVSGRVAAGKRFVDDLSRPVGSVSQEKPDVATSEKEIPDGSR
jgi:predicted DNA-binding protein